MKGGFVKKNDGISLCVCNSYTCEFFDRMWHEYTKKFKFGAAGLGGTYRVFGDTICESGDVKE